MAACLSLSALPVLFLSTVEGQPPTEGPVSTLAHPSTMSPCLPGGELFRSLSLIFSSFLSTGDSLVNKTQTLGLKASHSGGDIQREKSH